jgi:hypothetical protein
MRQLLEWSGMWVVGLGFVLGIVGIVVLIASEDVWQFYAAGWLFGGIGVLILLWSALRDRLLARKGEDLDDVGFN